MSEQTDKVVAEILTKAMEAAQATGAFVVEQAPDVVQQLLLFHTVKAWSVVGLGVLFCAGVLPIYKLALERVNKDLENNPRDYFGSRRTITDCNAFWIGVGTAGTSSFIGVMMFFTNIFEALKITLAPKVWLLEYAARLVS